MNPCRSQILAAELHWKLIISPLRCQKHFGHSGMHYHEQQLNLRAICGPIAVGWDGRDCWAKTEEVSVIQEGKEYYPEFVFQQMPEW